MKERIRLADVQLTGTEEEIFRSLAVLQFRGSSQFLQNLKSRIRKSEPAKSEAEPMSCAKNYLNQFRADR
jgi:hypothetical protein